MVLYVVSVGVALAHLGTWVVMLPAMVVAASMGLRVYMIQHDCLHRSFFKSRETNDLVGTLLSPISMTPYKCTRYIHNLHHTHVSDLDRRDTFEIDVMTLKEWEAASPGQRLYYRVDRSPMAAEGADVFFGNKGSNTVSVIDTSDWTVAKTVRHEAFDQPHGSAISPDGERVFISNNGSDGGIGSVVVIDVASLAVERVIPLGRNVAGLGTPAAG